MKKKVRIYKSPTNKGKYLNKTKKFLSKFQNGGALTQNRLLDAYSENVFSQLNSDMKPEDVYENLLVSGLDKEMAGSIMTSVITKMIEAGLFDPQYFEKIAKQTSSQGRAGQQPSGTPQEMGDLAQSEEPYEEDAYSGGDQSQMMAQDQTSQLSMQEGGDMQSPEMMQEQPNELEQQQEPIPFDQYMDSNDESPQLKFPNLSEYISSNEPSWNDISQMQTGGMTKKRFVRSLLKKQEGGDSQSAGTGDRQDTLTNEIKARKNDFTSTLKQLSTKALGEEIYDNAQKLGDPKVMEMAEGLVQKEQSNIPEAQKGGILKKLAKAYPDLKPVTNFNKLGRDELKQLGQVRGLLRDQTYAKTANDATLKKKLNSALTSHVSDADLQVLFPGTQGKESILNRIAQGRGPNSSKAADLQEAASYGHGLMTVDDAPMLASGNLKYEMSHPDDISEAAAASRFAGMLENPFSRTEQGYYGLDNAGIGTANLLPSLYAKDFYDPSAMMAATRAQAQNLGSMPIGSVATGSDDLTIDSKILQDSMFAKIMTNPEAYGVFENPLFTGYGRLSGDDLLTDGYWKKKLASQLEQLEYLGLSDQDKVMRAEQLMGDANRVRRDYYMTQKDKRFNIDSDYPILEFNKKALTEVPSELSPAAKSLWKEGNWGLGRKSPHNPFNITGIQSSYDFVVPQFGLGKNRQVDDLNFESGGYVDNQEDFQYLQEGAALPAAQRGGILPKAQFGYANVDEDLTDEERMSFSKTPEFAESARSMLDEDLYGGRGMGYDDMQYTASENLGYNEDKGDQVADYYDNILTNQGPAAFQNAINEGQDSYVSAIPFANNTNPFPAETISNPQMEALQNYTAPEDLREQGYLNNNLEAQQQYLAPGEQYSDVEWDNDYQYGGQQVAQKGGAAYKVAKAFSKAGAAEENAVDPWKGYDIRDSKINYNRQTVPYGTFSGRRGRLRDTLFPANRMFGRTPYVKSKTDYEGPMNALTPLRREVTKTNWRGKPKKWNDYYTTGSGSDQSNELQDQINARNEATKELISFDPTFNDMYGDFKGSTKRKIRRGERQANRAEEYQSGGFTNNMGVNANSPNMAVNPQAEITNLDPNQGMMGGMGAFMNNNTPSINPASQPNNINVDPNQAVDPIQQNFDDYQYGNFKPNKNDPSEIVKVENEAKRRTKVTDGETLANTAIAGIRGVAGLKSRFNTKNDHADYNDEMTRPENLYANTVKTYKGEEADIAGKQLGLKNFDQMGQMDYTGMNTAKYGKFMQEGGYMEGLEEDGEYELPEELIEYLLANGVQLDFM